MLDILDEDRQKVAVTDAHAAEIREYLEALDLLAHVPTETATGGPIDCVIFTQPGMRYAQARALVQALMASPALAATDRRLRRLVRDTVLSDVRGRMLEDVILFETMRALPPFQEAFKLEFAAGEYDMVVYDESSDTCDVFEIKHSRVRHAAQRRFLLDDACATACERVVAPIRRRVVLFCGEPGFEDGVHYENVSDYLLGLRR